MRCTECADGTVGSSGVRFETDGCEDWLLEGSFSQSGRDCTPDRLLSARSAEEAAAAPDQAATGAAVRGTR